VSQVFFNSGATCGPLEDLAAAVRDPGTLVAIDGYHGFMALPTDLSRIADRAFYIAGGYKYAMAGEGACFMHCPPGYAPRPRDTGWYAAFGALSARQTGVRYSEDGMRFAGATFDPSGFYRQRAVFAWMEAWPDRGGDPCPCARAPGELPRRVAAARLRAVAAGAPRDPDGDAAPRAFSPSRRPAPPISTGANERRIVTACGGDWIRFGFGSTRPGRRQRAVARHGRDTAGGAILTPPRRASWSQARPQGAG
jgi:hypothetical protein